MSLNSQLQELINQNLDVAISVYNEMKSNPKSLLKFTSQFGKIENNYDFIQGFILGDLLGSAFSTARTILSRPLTETERDDLMNIVQSKRSVVDDLVYRLKNA